MGYIWWLGSTIRSWLLTWPVLMVDKAGSCTTPSRRPQGHVSMVRDCSWAATRAQLCFTLGHSKAKCSIEPHSTKTTLPRTSPQPQPLNHSLGPDMVSGSSAKFAMYCSAVSSTSVPFAGSHTIKEEAGSWLHQPQQSQASIPSATLCWCIQWAIALAVVSFP